MGNTDFTVDIIILMQYSSIDQVVQILEAKQARYSLIEMGRPF